MKRTEVNKIARNFSRRALTMTELMIGLGLAAIIVLSAVLYTFKFSEKARVEVVKSELREAVTIALRRMEADFGSAIRVRGVDANAINLPGIFRRAPDGSQAGPRQDPSDNDGLVLFVTRNKELSIPVDNVEVVDVGGVRGLRGEVRISEVNAPAGTSPNSPEAIFAWNAQRYMDAALRAGHQWFLLSNASTNIILQVDRYIPPSGTNMDGTINFLLPPGFNLETEDFQDVPRIYHVAQVHYFLEGGDLYRGETFLNIIPPARDSVKILANVSQFQINYLFADRRDTRDTEPLNLPYEALSHPEDFHGVNEEPRLSWSDLSAISGLLRVSSDQPVNIESEASDGAFEIANGRITLTAQFVSSPSSFESLLQNSQQDTSDPCHPNNPSSRCNEACSTIFRDDSRESPLWEGYGRHVGTSDPEGVSDYCLCGTNPADPEDFIPPETEAGRNAVPNWSKGLPASDRQRLYACMRDQAQGCNNDWKFKDARYRFACSCTHDPEDFFEPGFKWYTPGDPNWNQGSDVPGGSDGRAARWSQLYQTLQILNDGDSPGVDGAPGNQNDTLPIRCKWWNLCGGSAEIWMPENPSSTHGGMETLCGCLTHYADETGSVTASQQIDRTQKVWSRLCNPTTCEDLYDSVGNYKIYGQAGPSGEPEQALSLTEATYCECRNQHPNPALDYRIASGSPDAPPSSPTSAGTVDSKVVTVQTETSTHTDQQCNVAQCNADANDSFGCCASQDLSGGILSLWLGRVDPVYASSHDGYCHGRCRDSTDVDETRRALVGDPLPSWCHGPSGGGNNAQASQ